MDPQTLPNYLLWVFGGAFAVINFRILIQFLRYQKLQHKAVIVWRGPKPAFYDTFFLPAAALVLVIIVKLAYLHWPLEKVFGETMMLLYFALIARLGVRICRGFYEDGVWLDDGFVPYDSIGGLSWRESETEPVTLLLVPRLQRRAYKLIVPTQYYGEARKLLREKIKNYEINMTGRALDLGAHDERDDV
jgi:hypothetical protein